VTNAVFILITRRNFEIPSQRSSVGVTESNIYENNLNYGSTYLECLLDDFKVLWYILSPKIIVKTIHTSTLNLQKRR
jgi:hypothetical protein